MEARLSVIALDAATGLGAPIMLSLLQHKGAFTLYRIPSVAGRWILACLMFALASSATQPPRTADQISTVLAAPERSDADKTNDEFVLKFLKP